MPQVVEIQKADDPRDVVHQAVQLLAEGNLVAFPTETVYVLAAHALQPDAVRRLQQVSRFEAPAAHVLAVKGSEEAQDFVPGMSALGLRMTRRSWPGPVTLVFDVNPDQGLWSALPEEARQTLSPDGQLALRVPAHPLILDVLRLMPAPLILSGEIRSQEPPAVTADRIAIEDSVSLVIDDGRCRYGQPSTVVYVAGDRWQMLREGVVSATLVGRLASEMYLFVCTGNTCRSPMAEAIFRKLLTERLGCSDESLVDHGYVAASAGLSAMLGGPAAPEAIEILQQRGIDLRSHESQPLTPRLLHQADHIFTMTQSHRESILAEYPELADRVTLLSPEGMDISDPIGAGLEEYSRCADELEQHLRAVLDNLDVGKSRT